MSGPDSHLDSMNSTTLGRKVTDAIKTAWAIAPQPKPDAPSIKATVLLRDGGLLLELDSSGSVDWLHEETNRKAFLDNIGSGANIKDRTYQVIVQFVPIEFNPDDDASIRKYEENNGLEVHSVLKAEWIKPVQDRKPLQWVATARFYHKDAKSANRVLSSASYVLNRKIVPKKPWKEPIRCLKCQQFGHERRHCTATTARCAKCACAQDTKQCNAPWRAFECVNCRCHHPSYDRFCQSFLDKCVQLDTCCPENSLAFYPTDEPWTWATVDQATGPRQQDKIRGQQHYDGPPFRSLAANTTPLGRGQHPGQQ